MSYLGRYQLGQLVPLSLVTRSADRAPAVPDTAPIAKVYNSGGTLVATKKMPVVDRDAQTGLFQYPLFLGPEYATGEYMVDIGYLISASAFAETFTFEVVAGGDSDGEVIAMYFYERPHAEHIVYQVSSGRLKQGRNPRV